MAEEAGAVVAAWESEVADLGEEEGVAGEIMQMLYRLALMPAILQTLQCKAVRPRALFIYVLISSSRISVHKDNSCVGESTGFMASKSVRKMHWT